jgi:hypothetical protein
VKKFALTLTALVLALASTLAAQAGLPRLEKQGSTQNLLVHDKPFLFLGDEPGNSRWQPGRRLNGDQTHQGRHIGLPPANPQIQKVRFYRYR